MITIGNAKNKDIHTLFHSLIHSYVGKRKTTKYFHWEEHKAVIQQICL